MLGLEPLLRERLAEIPGLLGVHGAADVGDIGLRVELPAVYVVWDGYTVSETSNNGRAARTATRWQVVLAVRNPLTPGDGAPVRSDAAPLLDAVLAKLLGWAPGYPYAPLVLANPGAITPGYRGGILKFPIAVTSEVVVRGA
ncbi:hypothetical protein [Accumulibacter sp.]|uniref:phage tail terminator protein n=1 Tax=Accumulibacter sp. TaxID=2053492 RepID=UPI0026346ABF|nr:hypothetical protein [Accumulibacter sp.]